MDYQVILLFFGFIAAVGGVLKIANGFRKDLQDTSSEYREDLDKTVKLLFKRFDDHKEDLDKKMILYQDAGDTKYQRKDMCVQVHNGVDKAFDRVCAELQGLRSDIKEIARAHESRG